MAAQTDLRHEAKREGARCPSEVEGGSGAGGGLDRRRLREVARAGDLGALRTLLRGLPPRSGGLLAPALHEAAAAGHAEAVRLLILHEADPSSTLQGECPAHRAAREGHVAALQELWRGGASPGARNEAGKCAIAVASNATTREAIAREVQRRQQGGQGASGRPAASQVSPPSGALARTESQEPSSALLARGRPERRAPARALGERPSNVTTGAPDAEHQDKGRWGKSPLGKEGWEPRGKGAKGVEDKENKAQVLQKQQSHNHYHYQASPPSASSQASAPGKARLELTCSICLTGYCTEPKTAPVTLPCGHTFCEGCVARLQGGKGSKAPTDGFKTSFRCPLDRQVFSRNLKLSVNSVLRDIIRDYGSLLSGLPQPSPLQPSPPPPHRTASPGGVRPTLRPGARYSPVLLRQKVDTATSPLGAEYFKRPTATSGGPRNE